MRPLHERESKVFEIRIWDIVCCQLEGGKIFETWGLGFVDLGILSIGFTLRVQVGGSKVCRASAEGFALHGLGRIVSLPGPAMIPG